MDEKSYSILYISILSMWFSLSDGVPYNTNTNKKKAAAMGVFNERTKHDGNFERIGSDTTNFWKILSITFLILVLIILFMCCYYYLYMWIFQVCKRYSKYQVKKENSENDFLNGKAREKDCFIKHRSSMSKSLLHKKYDVQRDRFYGTDKCSKLISILQEKKRLFTPRNSREGTVFASRDYVELAKKRSNQDLKPLTSSIEKKQAFRKLFSIADNNDRKSGKCIRLNKHFKNRINRCFSDTDAKFLKMSISSRKSCPIDQDQSINQCKWSSERTNDYFHWKDYRSFKSIDTNSLNDYTQNYEISNSKYLSNSGTVSDKYNSQLNKSNESSVVLMHMKLKSITRNSINANSMNDFRILEDPKKEISYCQRISKSDEIIAKRITHSRLCNNDNCVPIKSDRLIPEINDTSTLSFYMSESSDICEGIGMVFLEYMKLQARPCRRKYCFLSRHLRHRTKHDASKCEMRFIYRSMHPYDQRPTCSSANICKDTYDELKLMRVSPSERKHVYQCMFIRRKQFLNQPYVLTISQSKPLILQLQDSLNK